MMTPDPAWYKRLHTGDGKRTCRPRLVCLALLGLLSFTLVASPKRPASAQSQPTAEQFLEIAGTVFTYQEQTVYLRGTNVSNIGGLGIWQTPSMDGIQTKREDYFKLKEMGGNHVRFGLSLPWYNQDRARFWRELDQQISWAREAGIFFLPLLFVTEDNCYEGYSSSCDIWRDSAEQDRLVDFWVEVARRYRHEATVIGFDYLNEPTPPGPGWCSTWFALAQRLRDAVFAVHPQALAFIEACSDGEFPRRFRGDNIVYQVHHYMPLAASHNEDGSAVYPGWLPDWDGKQVYWSKETMRGSGDERADVRARLSIHWAKTQQVPLYVGEWGTRSPYQGWETYLTDVASLLNEWGTHWAHYSWRHLPGTWDTFPAEGPLVPQNVPTYRMLLWAFRGQLNPDQAAPPTATQARATATVVTTASATKSAPLPTPTPTSGGHTQVTATAPATALATARPTLPTATVTPLAQATLHPTIAPVRPLALYYKAGQPAASSSMIELQVYLVNQGATPIDLSALTLRYYFSDPGLVSDYVTRCEVAEIGCQHIQLWIGQLNVARQGATHYLEVGFVGQPALLTLAPGAKTGYLSLQVHRQDWQDFDQTDDFSFSAGAGGNAGIEQREERDDAQGDAQSTATSQGYQRWDKIAVFESGQLIAGREPDPLLKPLPLPAVSSLMLRYQTLASAPQTNTIAPRLEIVNASTRTVNLGSVRLRYYFSAEMLSGSKLHFRCLSALLGCQHVRASLGLASPTAGEASAEGTVSAQAEGASSGQTTIPLYLELSFDAQVGLLAPAQSSGLIAIELTISRVSSADAHTADPTLPDPQFNQSDDYSFDPTKTTLTPWDQITLYLDNSLVWGKPPSS